MFLSCWHTQVEGVRAWFAKYLAPGAPGRRKISFHVQPTKAGCPSFSPEGSAEAMKPVEAPPPPPAAKAVGKGKAAASKGKKAAGGKGGEAAAAASSLQAKRTVVPDLLAWRGEQEQYPVIVEPEPVFTK